MTATATVHPIRDSEQLAARVASQAPASGTYLAFDATSPEHSWVAMVEASSRILLERLGSLPDGPAVLVVAVPTTPNPMQAAAIAAMRGTIGVAALERAPRGSRVNTILLGEQTTDHDLAAALGYLVDEEAAGFTAGATLDLSRGNPLSDRRRELPVLVTGAAGGLGGAVAEAFVAAGRSVVISDIDGEALDRQADQLGVEAVGCDVTSPADIVALASHPALAAGISSLQVLHGVGGAGALDELDLGVRERSLRINGTGVFNVVEALAPAVRQGGGSVVVLSSQAGLIAEPGNGAYCAAKFAAVGYVDALAATLTDVRVHGLCPGPIDTPLMRDAFSGMAAAAGVTYEQYYAQRLAVIPLGRFGKPRHMGEAALLLDRLDTTGVIVAPTGAFLLT